MIPALIGAAVKGNADEQIATRVLPLADLPQARSEAHGIAAFRGLDGRGEAVRVAMSFVDKIYDWQYSHDAGLTNRRIIHNTDGQGMTFAGRTLLFTNQNKLYYMDWHEVNNPSAAVQLSDHADFSRVIELDYSMG